ncbi:glycine cleavage system protein H [Nocardia sp. NPDC049149]|uniref:glycine cleavage system protein H n=1 Tax=Nocardia sp. NPDC049149 TaxID=3364315 RepID=UPI003715DD1B
MPAIPVDRSYTRDHEWVVLAPGADLPDAPVRVGITAIAVDSLGDLVFVDLPAVGSTITVGSACGEVESTKAVSELFPPVSGRVTLVNQAVVDDPTLITSDPYDQGWLFAVLPSAAGELLTAAQYGQLNGVAPQ